MAPPEKRPARQAHTGHDQDVVEYVFNVNIDVRAPGVDERRVRELIGEEIAKLHLAVKSRTG
jgi:hypothetical protein